MKEGTPKSRAVCQRLAKHAPSGCRWNRSSIGSGVRTTLMSSSLPLRDTTSST